jgi:hypothetical protein
MRSVLQLDPRGAGSRAGRAESALVPPRAARGCCARRRPSRLPARGCGTRRSPPAASRRGGRTGTACGNLELAEVLGAVVVLFGAVVGELVRPLHVFVDRPVELCARQWLRPRVEPTEVAAVEHHGGRLVLRRVGRPGRLVPIQHGTHICRQGRPQGRRDKRLFPVHAGPWGASTGQAVVRRRWDARPRGSPGRRSPGARG